jgi:CRISPR system Cascade subunit CasD
MTILAFRLCGPLAAWGTGEAGETDRPTARHPGRSAVFGLLGAALGLKREDEEAHARLAAGYRLAVAGQGARRILRDYRTVQTVEPNRAQRKTGFVTRKQALETGKVHTMITRRDYVQDGLWRVFLAPRDDAAYSPRDLAAALKRPTFELYLGRRDCPLMLPPDPQVLDDAPLEDLLATYPALPASLTGETAPRGLRRMAERFWKHDVNLAWEPDFPGPPEADTAAVSRRQVSDEPLSRSLRRFAHREERGRDVPNPEADAAAIEEVTS